MQESRATIAKVTPVILCRGSSEHWVVVKGLATVIRGDRKFKLRANESTYIHVEETHQLWNDGLDELEVVEVPTGTYFEEDDIMRFEDLYGRNWMNSSAVTVAKRRQRESNKSEIAACKQAQPYSST